MFVSYSSLSWPVKLVILLGEEDLAEFVAETLCLFFSGIIHWHHVGGHLLSTLDGRIDTGKEHTLAILRDHSLSIRRNRVFDVQLGGVRAWCFGSQLRMVGIGEVFIERASGPGALLRFGGWGL